jgi:hypothetical protein
MREETEEPTWAPLLVSRKLKLSLQGLSINQSRLIGMSSETT